MIKKTVKLNNKLGLHARPAAVLVREAEKFTSEIILEKDTKEVNLKSILGIVWLKVVDGEELTIKAKGRDEEEAVERIANLIEGRLQDISYKQKKGAVAKEIEEEPAKYDVPQPIEVVDMIGQGVREAIKSIESTD